MKKSYGPHVSFEALRCWLGRGGPASIRDCASALGASSTTVQYWVRAGVTLDTAERLAIGLGAHPSEIWPWFDEIEPCWRFTPWLRRRRSEAVAESWRLRIELDEITYESRRA